MKHSIIKRPIVSEKSIELASKENTYVFQVARTANKNQIKAIIEEFFAVKVLSVNTILSNKTTRKTGKKRLTRKVGKIKKALVKLQSGDKIDLFDTFK